MVLTCNNVTKCTYNSDQPIRIGCDVRTYGQTYVRTDGQGQHLISRPLSWRGHKNVFISLKTNFVLANSVDPDEMQHYDILSGSSPFAKVIGYGDSGIQRVKGR